MSNPSETGGRPLASNLPQHTEAPSQPSLLRSKRRRSSQSSDERVGGSKSPSSRRRPATRIEASFGPHAGSSREDSSTMQRSTSPNQMSPEGTAVNYTKTGRISKAKKGLKVHNCESCGKSYTRAEHLRRHQRNHNPDAQICDFPDCGKSFHRPDLLQRHRERHALGKDSPQTPFNNEGPGVDSESLPPSVTTAGPTVMGTSVSTPPYYGSSASPYQPEPSRSSKHTNTTTGHQLPVAVPVSNEQGFGMWGNESFSPYTPSSDYPSPIPGPSDMSIFTTNHFGPSGEGRTRASSINSFDQPTWVYPPQSPASATSNTMVIWPPNEKSPGTAAQSLLPSSSYPLSTIPMSAPLDLGAPYLYPSVKSLAQRDDEDQRALFPDQFGMANITDTYQYEQYFDNYWRLFHPTFPVIHQPTFGGMTESPMLRAAMLAVGAQYSSDPCAKRKARILLDRCIKRLDAREVESVPEPPRLSDYQAIFLLEVATQYRARRAVQGLSKRFEEMYQKFSQEFNRHDTSSVLDSIAALNLHDGSGVIEHWQQWIALSSQQRLLQCCYILETQQTTLLARPPKTSVIHVTGYELPFPAPATLWEAQSASEWAMAASHYHHLPSDLIEATTSMPAPFDRFQSNLLIAAHYNHFENSSPFLSVPNPNMGTIDHLVDNSSITQHHLFTAKLLQGTPIRALLAVSGESWILSEKVTSMQSFSSFRNTLKTWVNELWDSSPDSGSLIVKEAVKAAIGILQLGLLDEELPVEFGVDMGMYYASLVIWAVTVAATIRTRPHGQPVRHPSPHPLSSHRSSHYPSSSTHLNPSNSNSPNPLHSNNLGLHQPPITSSPTSPSKMLRIDVTNHSLNFLERAVVEIDLLNMAPQWPQDVAQWQQGCVALLQWTKLRIRKGSLEGRDSVISAGPTSAGTGRGSDSMGELLDSVLTNLEKVMGRGWDSWVM